MRPNLVLTVEDLIWALKDCVTIAGFNGSCERVIKYDCLVKKLKRLVDEVEDDQS